MTAASRAAPGAPPLDPELERLLRRMRLPYIRNAAPELLATAKAQRWDPAEVLKALLVEEVSGRDRSALATRRARAGFPTGNTFAAWDPELSSIPAPTQQALRTLEWVHWRENLIVCGPAGHCKTFLPGLHVDWFNLESLGVLVRRHRVDDTVTKAITRILRSDLVMVMVDDISLNFSRDLFGWDVVRAGRRVGLIVPDGYGRSAGVARGRAFHGRWVLGSGGG